MEVIFFLKTYQIFFVGTLGKIAGAQSGWDGREQAGLKNTRQFSKINKNSHWDQIALLLSYF